MSYYYFYLFGGENQLSHEVNILTYRHNGFQY